MIQNNYYNFPGYTGSDCEIEINECEPDPCYNGFCNDLINDYDCLCEKGWTGKNCDIDIDDCMDKPCQNGGYCNDLLNDYQVRQENIVGRNSHLA